ncbi:MAG: hypothetical protein HYS78_01705 [Parcubacteria group bacterium]|nr:hypothetical protein [Parcubacteria group bacterium]
MQARTVLIVGVVGVLAAGVFAASRPIGNGYIVAVSDSEGLPWDEQRLGPGVSRIPVELQASMRPGDELVFIGNRRTAISEFWDDMDVRRGREVFLPLFRFSSGTTEQRVLSPSGGRWQELEVLPYEVVQARDAGHLAMERALAAVQEVSR